MRNGFLVVFGVLAVSAAIGLFLARQYRTDLTQTQDLVLGLIYFMEQNGGRLPASQDEFLSSSVVERGDSGTFRVVAPPVTKYRPRTHGIPIADLAPFQVNWGVDLGGLTVDERGVARDAQGRKVEVLRWPSSPTSGKGYTIVLLGAYQEIAAGSPASNASSPATRPGPP